VDLSVSTSRTVTLGSLVAATALEESPVDPSERGNSGTAAVAALAAVAAMELTRKFRRFMSDKGGDLAG
jgi:hypothetical protein